jgi:hypothetical protein
LGRDEIYIQPFPKGGGKWQVSTTGGTQPRWRRDGRELFYLGADRQVMAVDVQADAKTFVASSPKALFGTRLGIRDTPGNYYAVTRDGQRFLLSSVVTEETNRAPITIVLNWPAALKK